MLATELIWHRERILPGAMKSIQEIRFSAYKEESVISVKQEHFILASTSKCYFQL